MFGIRERKELERLRDRLVDVGGTVAPEARDFHRWRMKILQSVDHRLHRGWKLWLPAKSLEELQDEVEHVIHLADPILDLMDQAQRLEGEIRELQARPLRQGERNEPLPIWIEERAETWLQRVTRIRRTSARRSEIDLGRTTLESLEREVRRHSRAVELMLKAETLVDKARSNPRIRLQVAQLEADLPELRRRLFDEGPLPSWIDEMERGCDIQIVELDREFTDLNALQRDLPEWRRVLGKRDDHLDSWLRDLDDPTRSPEHRDDEELENLLDQGHGHLEKLKAEAESKKKQRWDRLERLLEDLANVCGGRAALSDDLHDLSTLELSDPRSYEDWQEAAGAFERKLQGEATRQRSQLETQRYERKQDLEGRLEALAARPLSSSMREQLDAVTDDLAMLAMGDDAFELLRDLSKLRDLASRVEALDKRATDESSEVERIREQLVEGTQLLQQEAESVGLTLADLSHSIEELSESGGAPDLERVRSRLRELEDQQQQQCKIFLDHCRSMIDAETSVAREIADVLTLPVDEVIPVDELQVRADMSPPEIGEAVKQAARTKEKLEGRLGDRLSELSEAAACILNDVGALDRSRFSPAELDHLDHAADNLRSAIQADAPDLDRCRRIDAATEKLRKLLEGLTEAAERAVELREEILARSRWITQELKLQELEQLISRVVGLVTATPRDPEIWPGTDAQLREAKALLQDLETHGRRIAAEELSTSLRILEQNKHRADDNDAEGRVDTALQEIDRCAHGQLPPLDLRNRIRDLAEELDPGSDTRRTP